MCKDLKACTDCETKFGKMAKVRKNSKMSSNLALGAGIGGAATVLGAKVIGKVAGSSSASLTTGLGAAVLGYAIYDRAKQPIWKGAGLGMMGGGAFIAADETLGETVDGVLNNLTGSTTTTATLSNEEALLAALNAANTGGSGTGGTNFLF